MTTTVMFRCKHCPNATINSGAVARAQGWRMWSGTTQGGKHLDDVVCPNCAGHFTEGQTEPTWTVGCRTCDWVYEPWSVEDRIEDGKGAQSTARDHECEPSVWIRCDGVEGEFTEWDIDRDGKLKAEAIEREAQSARELARLRERAS